MAETITQKIKPGIKRQIRDYRKTLKKAQINVSQIILFGSQAKGITHKWSDIDLAIISPDFGKDYFDEMVMLARLRDDSMLDIEPHPLHPNDLKEKWSTLAAEIRTHGIPIAF